VKNTILHWTVILSRIQYRSVSAFQYCSVFRGPECSTRWYWTRFSTAQYFFCSVLTCGVEYKIIFYTWGVLHPRCRILFYTKLLYWTEFNIVQYSCFSIVHYFVVRLDNTECCSVLLSIFSAQFWPAYSTPRVAIYTSVILHPRCRILFYNKLLYWTEFSIAQYFVILGVVMGDTEHSSAVFFLVNFGLRCRIERERSNWERKGVMCSLHRVYTGTKTWTLLLQPHSCPCCSPL